MFSLKEAKIGKVVEIKELHVSEDVLKHLHNLGLVPGAKIALVAQSGKHAIILLHRSRLAIDPEMLQNIFVAEPAVAEKNWLSLDQLAVGESATVVSIHGQGAVKRRLMDMGLTRGVTLHLRKAAPLGDPIEITLRGYELSLRKSEAQLVLVAKEEQE